MANWLQDLLNRSKRLPAELDAPDRPATRVPTPPLGSLAEQPAPDRRQWPRIPLQLQVRLRFATAQAMVDCRTFDISEGGAFIGLRQPRPRGTKVRLSIEVADRTLVIGGEVMRASDGKSGGRCGMGIRFTEVTPEDAHYLAELLSQKL